MSFSLNIKGRLHEFDRPAVMGILNVTPDSFYASSRTNADNVASRALELIADGADIVDIGAYSTRPGHDPVSQADEVRRLEPAVKAIREAAPDAIISVDTFRAEVAMMAVGDWGADMVNDISGGDSDEKMFDTVASLKAPYVLCHNQPANTAADANQFVCDTITSLARRLQRLALMGVCDVIVDPGIGFGKTVRQNYDIIANLRLFEVLQRPILVGVSRKSMITKQLNITVEEALNGTTVLNTLAVERGASILRVHDPRAAREAIALCEECKPSAMSPSSVTLK